MENLVFKDNWKDFFASYGLVEFDEIFAHSAPDWMHTKKRIVSGFTLGTGDDEKHFFIKRFLRPHFKDMLFTLWAPGGLRTQARYEWDCANTLLSHGIGTYRPVCIGERTAGPIERRSFFITERLGSLPLSAYVKTHWPTAEREDKAELMRQTARFVRKIHDAGINFPDLYVWHIFVAEKGGDRRSWDFDIIDLHRMTINCTDRRKFASNLGRLDYSMLDEYFDNDLRRIFLETYARGLPLDVDQLTAEVKKVSRNLLKKRNQKPY